MRTEIDWLKNFKANLREVLARENLLARERVIVWEIEWINARLETLGKAKTE